ncbi:transcriptional regulator, TetR family [Novosphingobium sp. CF614]|uniref:TetR/AcrR family transcriptional regulator n=1 Tax=Novosphingobium sp. CF614 TaxID=1884364 RepID=UPI0008E40E9A|nr:TetR/AcrR family transcriptional regulator [Novosphingobium sp. CF614]SFG01021.1 transcriptional regulator, TetR family [Novosphingobium sp. CF614]
MSLSTRIVRKDAKERRERLITAAVDLFGREGFDVPLEKIACLAGVSRMTLYRNFPNRETIIAAVQQVHLERVQELVAQWADRDDAFLLAINMMAEKTLNSGGFEKLLASRNSTEAHTEVFVSGVTSILSEPLERAKAAGLVRKDFDISLVGMVILMLSGGALTRTNGDRPVLDMALDLLTTGLAPRSKPARD